MELDRWALAWGVPAGALVDLRRQLGMADQPPPPDDLGLSEGAVQSRVRLQASRIGWRTWRNNVGAGVLSNGSFVRWGLANDSAQLNKTLKSSDLIGCRPRVITQDDVDSTIGQFVSLEIKEAGWKFNPKDEREVAQARWLGVITGLGGHARFVTSEQGML